MGEFDDIIPEYVAESTELLETVENGLLQMESGGLEDEAIHTVFRAIHSIKGGAGFVGLDKIEHLAHKMEDLLNLIRNGDLPPTRPVTDSLLQSLDVLTSLFERIDEHEGIDIEGPIRALEAALDSGAEEEAKRGIKTPSRPEPGSGLPFFEVSRYSLEKKFQAGNVFHIKLDMTAIEERGLTPIQLVNEMLSMGEIVDSQVILPDAGDLTSEEPLHLSFHILYATVLEADLLEAALHLNQEDFRLVGMGDFGFSEDKGQAAAQAGPEPSKPRPEPPREPEAPKPAPRAPDPQPQPAQPAELAVVESYPQAQTAQALADAAPKSSAGEYLTFKLGEETYGVDILCVQEIIGIPHLTRLPRAPKHALGVMNLRGSVVPVLDLRILLGLNTRENDEPVVVVFLSADKIHGAVVDGVEDVIEFTEEEIQEPPEFAGPVKREFLRGLTRSNGEMVILLELDRLLTPES